MLAYKTFSTSLESAFTRTGKLALMESLRQKAQEFINQEIGNENVLTIAENILESRQFYVTIWYRTLSQ